MSCIRVVPGIAFGEAYYGIDAVLYERIEPAVVHGLSRGVHLHDGGTCPSRGEDEEGTNSAKVYGDIWMQLPYFTPEAPCGHREHEEGRGHVEAYAPHGRTNGKAWLFVGMPYRHEHYLVGGMLGQVVQLVDEDALKAASAGDVFYDVEESHA